METFETGRSHNQLEASLPFAIEGRAQALTFLLSTARFDVRGEPRVLVVIQDITDRKRAEQEMARLASFPMLNPQPVVEVDMDGRVCFANPAAQHLFPDLQQPGPNHPWLSNWDSLANARREPSALSQLNFGIDRLEFASGIVNFHLPIDTALGTVDVV